jgi:hypothetical protein
MKLFFGENGIIKTIKELEEFMNNTKIWDKIKYLIEC